MDFLTLANKCDTLTKCFLETFNDEEALLSCLGMALDTWTAVNGGSTVDMLEKLLPVAKAVNIMFGAINKEDLPNDLNSFIS